MASGVWINGHRYKQRDAVVFTPMMTVAQRAAAGSLSPNLVGTINMFYIVKNPGRTDELYFSVTNRPILRMYGDLYIVASVQDEAPLPGLHFIHDRADHRVAHVDAIAAKIMLAPHTTLP